MTYLMLRTQIPEISLQLLQVIKLVEYMMEKHSKTHIPFLDIKKKYPKYFLHAVIDNDQDCFQYARH